MNNEKFAPFYVGQEVEAVESHHQGVFKKGDKFVITGVFISACTCPGWEVTVGISHTSSTYGCVKCGKECPSTGEWRFMSTRFRALTPAMQAVTFEKITEQHPVSVN